MWGKMFAWIVQQHKNTVPYKVEKSWVIMLFSTVGDVGTEWIYWHTANPLQTVAGLRASKSFLCHFSFRPQAAILEDLDSKRWENSSVTTNWCVHQSIGNSNLRRKLSF